MAGQNASDSIPPSPILSQDFYGYLPSASAAIFGIAFFSTAAVIGLIQIVFGRYKHYWMVMIPLAGVGEALGWGARFWSHSSPGDWMPYMIQFCSIAVTPVLISATDYFLFCQCIGKLENRLFSLPTWAYWTFFLICDFISIAIQTVGGVEVSSATDLPSIDAGGIVARNGIIFQFSNTVIFALFVPVTALYLHWRKEPRTLLDVAGWAALIAMGVSTAMLLVRNAYRIVELSDGWNGRVMRTEGYLIGLDLAPMAVAVGVFLICSPSLSLAPRAARNSGKLRRSSQGLEMPVVLS